MERNDPEVLEPYTIGYVPAERRHGRVRDLFTLWFGTNIAPLPIVTGALGPQLFHLDLVSTLLAILVGHLAGGLLMALHSAQGPQLGVPQMLQSRGQFGSYGALLVVLIAAVMYVGFFASNIILAGKSLHGINDAVPVNAGIVLGAAASAVICVIGYRLIHFLNRVATWLMGIGIVAGTVVIIARGLPDDFLTKGHYTFAGFLAMVSLGALWQIAFAPYVSDYSRYMPADVKVSGTFWTTYLGSALGSMLSFVFGAVIALAYAGDDAIAGAAELTGGFGTTMLALFLFNVVNHNALNLYGAVLSLITTAQTFKHSWIPRAGARGAVSVIVFAGCVLLALLVSQDFVSSFVNLVLALLIVLVPWTAINLIDFYLINHGSYDIDSFFHPSGGIYGRFNAIALVTYAIGIAVQIPFMATDLYTGPLVERAGGADLSWLVGLLVTGPVYYALARRRTGPRHKAVPRTATAAPG